MFSLIKVVFLTVYIEELKIVDLTDTLSILVGIYFYVFLESDFEKE